MSSTTITAVRYIDATAYTSASHIVEPQSDLITDSDEIAQINDDGVVTIIEPAIGWGDVDGVARITGPWGDVYALVSIA